MNAHCWKHREFAQSCRHCQNEAIRVSVERSRRIPLLGLDGKPLPKERFYDSRIQRQKHADADPATA